MVKKTGVNLYLILVIIAVALLIYPNFTREESEVSNNVHSVSGQLLSNINSIWSRIPLLNQLDITQAFIGFLIVYIVYKWIYN